MRKRNIVAGVLAVVLVAAYPVYRAMFGVEAVQVDTLEQAVKISKYAHPEAFITPASLKDLQDSGKDVVVIGALNPARGDSPIQGSFTLWRSDYSAPTAEYDYGGMRCDKEIMEALLSKFGATHESTIVVYSANRHHDAARLYWQIKMLGHKDVRYLDGGLNAWVGANLPTGSANPAVQATVYKAPDYNENQLATFEQVVNATQDGDWVIIDVRSLAERQGETTSKGAYGPGAIPGSEFFEWTMAVNEDTTLKDLEALKAVYGEVIKGKRVITYCQSGVRSAHTQFVLKEVLGADEVYNYDGSWIEWSHAHYQEHRPGAEVLNGQG